MIEKIIKQYTLDYPTKHINLMIKEGCNGEYVRVETTYAVKDNHWMNIHPSNKESALDIYNQLQYMYDVKYDTYLKSMRN